MSLGSRVCQVRSAGAHQGGGEGDEQEGLRGATQGGNVTHWLEFICETLHVLQTESYKCINRCLLQSYCPLYFTKYYILYPNS